VSLDRKDCYRALLAHDPAFDGVFFIGVKTTGIYCRPICPARVPMFERCEFFRTAAAAERGGFRACLRCRPELAPLARPMDGVSELVQAAHERIAAGDWVDGDAAALAHRLGADEAELRAAIERELGVTPEDLRKTQRFGLAKRLLTDSTLAVSEVATAAGYSGSRQLSAACQATFGRAPSELRRRIVLDEPESELALRLDYRPPFDVAWAFEFLRHRACPGLERVDGLRYQRSVVLGASRGWLQIQPDPKRTALIARVSASLGSVLLPLMASARALFDLDARPDRVAACFALDPILAPRVAARPGLRVPGAFNRFEIAVRGVLGQQVSVAAATTLCSRLVKRFGEPIATPWPEIDRLFPTPDSLVEAGVSDLAAIGMPRSRAETLHALARSVASGKLDLTGRADPEHALQALRQVRGVGPWTASYIAMRGLHWPDAFPAGDLGVRKALGMASQASVERSGEAWRPFRAYAVMHLWAALS
jgi:AraC family transcriptional regulator of adaptative response / DNA-3-methyladenine glycosylase II